MKIFIFCFSPGQLAEIEKIELNQIICEDSDEISQVPESAFRHQSPVTACSSITLSSTLDLEKWLEQCDDDLSI